MESLRRIATRRVRRLTGQEVGLDFYDQIWAEMLETGEPVHDSISDKPPFRIIADRSEGETWSVRKEKRITLGDAFTLGVRAEVLDIGSPMAPTPWFVYVLMGEKEIMTTEAVIKLMKLHDPEPRNVSQHYTRALSFA